MPIKNHKKIIIIAIIVFILSFILMAVFLEIFDHKDAKQTSEANIQEQIVTSEKNKEKPTNIHYLHKSSLELPDKKDCFSAQYVALRGLDEEIQKTVQEKIRFLHLDIENLLVDGCKILKDKDSKYWEVYQTIGSFENVYYEKAILPSILDTINLVKDTVQSKGIKTDMQKAAELWNEGINNRDIGKFYEAHEIIHDADYWVMNCPPAFESYPPVDWAGAQVYFGKTSLL